MTFGSSVERHRDNSGFSRIYAMPKRGIFFYPIPLYLPDIHIKKSSILTYINWQLICCKFWCHCFCWCCFVPEYSKIIGIIRPQNHTMLITAVVTLLFDFILKRRQGKEKHKITLSSDKKGETGGTRLNAHHPFWERLIKDVWGEGVGVVSMMWMKSVCSLTNAWNKEFTDQKHIFRLEISNVDLRLRRYQIA